VYVCIYICIYEWANVSLGVIALPLGFFTYVKRKLALYVHILIYICTYIGIPGYVYGGIYIYI